MVENKNMFNWVSLIAGLSRQLQHCQILLCP